MYPADVGSQDRTAAPTAKDQAAAKKVNIVFLFGLVAVYNFRKGLTKWRKSHCTVCKPVVY